MTLNEARIEIDNLDYEEARDVLSIIELLKENIDLERKKRENKAMPIKNYKRPVCHLVK